jgi:glycosyltransferase involved in cell wall biosynthesis
MHVAIVSHDILRGDGQGRVNYELACHLLDHGIEVDLLADRVDSSLLDRGATWIPIRPSVRSVNLLRVWRFRHLADRALEARDDQYDIVLACGVVLDRPHTVNVAHFVHGAWIDSPYHASQQHDIPYSWYHRLYGALNARWEQDVWTKAEVIVAVSENVRRDIAELGVPPEHTKVIHNGVDTDEYSPGTGNRSRFDLPSDPVLALFAGDLQSPIKNLDTVLRALQCIPELHLAVAGTTDGSPYPALVDRLGLSNRVHFLGFRTDMADLMRSVDFFVLLSHQDAFGLTVTEAMASGLPVVVSREVGASGLVSQKEGIVVDPPDDVKAATEAFQYLTSNPEARRTMGAAARARASDHSWARMGDEYLALFRQLTASSLPSSHPA